MNETKNPERYAETTPIKNDVLEKLIGAARILSASEIACALFIYRKTIGWKKKTDKISISQFTRALNVSKPTICKSLKTLRLVKIALLVKKGLHKHLASEWAFNENPAKWELVKKPLLVKKSKFTSKEIETELVKKSRPTKQTLTKRTIQNTVASATGGDHKISKFLFSEIQKTNPAFAAKFPTEKSAEKKIAAWADDIEKLRRIDNATAAQIESVLRWLATDNPNANFWRKNILSGKKLREKFQQLVAAAFEDARASRKNQIKSF